MENSGVGGWLLVLCVWLIVLQPVSLGLIASNALQSYDPFAAVPRSFCQGSTRARLRGPHVMPSSPSTACGPASTWSVMPTDPLGLT